MTMTTYPTATPRPAAAIAGITEAPILQYFASLNAGNFEATADLFAPTGVLYPPFEQGIVGPAAIAAYLSAEAQGMQFYPQAGVSSPLADGSLKARVQGRVQTPWFGVNVAWDFLLQADQHLASVQIELLASLQELLELRQSVSD